MTININRKINEIIRQAKLDKEQNNFFKNAKLIENISIESATQIAFNWSEITKTFLYTSIRGLTPFVDRIFENTADPNEELLSVLQTSFYIILDDLNSAHPIFKKIAPKGVSAIHFKWWNNSILHKLIPLSKVKPYLTKGVQNLLLTMKEISNSPFGTPVQLRVVEAIALDICLAFNAIFSKLIFNGELVFNSENDKAWIASHIEAEMFHKGQVCDEESGMALVIMTLEDEFLMLKLIEEYALIWSEALNDFYNSLIH